MTFCPECGNKIQENHQFCNKCGADMHLLEKKSISTLEPKGKPYQPAAPVLVRRNYWLWWLLTYIISPMAYLYLYFNFEDLNNLIDARPLKEGPALKTKKNDIMMYIVLSVVIPFFIIVVRYWKYDRFYKYLQYNGVKDQTIPMSGKKMAWVSAAMLILVISGSVFFGLMALPIVFYEFWLFGLFIGLGFALTLVGMGLGFYTIYAEYIWQKAMNEQVLMIDPNAEEKTLF